jgi:cyclic beta-1,2-glucan synthetase
MYRAGIEGILGIRREGTRLLVEPCIPAAWPGFEATVTVQSTRYEIRVENAPGGSRAHAVLDGTPVALAGGEVNVPLDGGTHRLVVHLGDASPAATAAHRPAPAEAAS